MYARTLTAIWIGALGLAACTTPEIKLSDDFGRALHEDLVAQIADPDAHYLGKPDPGSDGTRVAGAQKKYAAGKVIRPGRESQPLIPNGEAASGEEASAGAGTGTASASPPPPPQ